MNSLKLQFQGEVRLASPYPTLYSDLQAIATDFFSMDVLGFTYIDNSNEKITIDCDTDLVEMKEYAQQQGKPSMKLEVLPVETGVSMIDQIPIMDSYYPAVPDEELKQQKVRNASANTERAATNDMGNNPIATETNETGCTTAVQMEDQCNETEVIEKVDQALGTSMVQVQDNASHAQPDLCDAQNSAAPLMQSMGNDAPVLVELDRHTSAVHMHEIATEVILPTKCDASTQFTTKPSGGAKLNPEEVRLAINAEMQRLVPQLRDSMIYSLRQSQINAILHPNTVCDFCKVSPIAGDRYFCPKCRIDICSKCEIDHNHNLVKYKRPMEIRPASPPKPVLPPPVAPKEYPKQPPFAKEENQKPSSIAIEEKPEPPPVQEEEKPVIWMNISEKISYLSNLLDWHDLPKLNKVLQESKGDVQMAINKLLTN